MPIKAEPNSCEECGKSFLKQNSAKFFSGKCRSRAHRKRQADHPIALKIIEEKPIRLAESRRDELLGQYQAETRNWYGVMPPPSFESWVRSRGCGK